MSKGLTSYRAIAFFAIFLFHSSKIIGANSGYIGVLAFFVLSGYLLTPILVNMKSSLNEKDFFVHFYGRRALRIFPLYFFYIILVASTAPWVISHFGYSRTIPLSRFMEQLPWLLTYTYDFFPITNGYSYTVFANHFWSLAVEEQFYLLWPLAIFFIPTNHVKRFLLLVIVIGPVMRLMLAKIFDANVPSLHVSTDLAIYFMPFSHVDAFAVGGYFALFGKSRPTYVLWVSIFLVILLGLLTSWLSTNQVNYGQIGYVQFMKDSYKYVWGYSLVNLLFASMLVHIKNKSFLPGLFENPLLVYLGTISYGLYVYHLPVLWLVRSTMSSYPGAVQLLSGFLITILISMASYEFMEKRFTNLKDKYFSKVAAN